MRADPGLVFHFEEGWTFKIDTVALHKMQTFVQHRNTDHEAGGVLLGRYIRGTQNVVVDEITVPLPSDQSSPTRFYRHRQGHQVLIDQCWTESEGTCNYLGEWHTHPEDVPTPSGIDLRNWRKLVSETQQDFAGLFFVIVGRTVTVTYYVSREPLKILPLYVQK